ncbi:superinfection immunity protein [Salmonella enterica]|nr:superinfection immunity protein [Salmonella enterica]
MGGVILLLILLFCYFIPTVIACNRKHGNTAAIVCVNILLGWTFIGWVVALTWSLTNGNNKAAH